MRLIESNKVIPLVRLMLMNHPKADAICENMQKIVDIHTIEAEPVVHGKWIDAREFCGDYMCSNCDALYGTNKFNYCPNCGAKMDGGAE